MGGRERKNTSFLVSFLIRTLILSDQALHLCTPLTLITSIKTLSSNYLEYMTSTYEFEYSWWRHKHLVHSRKLGGFILKYFYWPFYLVLPLPRYKKDVCIQNPPWFIKRKSSTILLSITTWPVSKNCLLRPTHCFHNIWRPHNHL